MAELFYIEISIGDGLRLCKAFAGKIFNYILHLVELPNIAGGDRGIKVILKRTNDIHDIKGIQGEILQKIGFVSNAGFSGYIMDDSLYQFKHNCLLYQLCGV